MQHITVSQVGHVTTVTLNRPEVLNAINPVMHDELEMAFNAFEDDSDQYICVVKGAGRGFCAGSDLKAAAAAGSHVAYPAHGYAGLVQRFHCPKPFIASVNGLALGGGFEIALACDVIVAAESASFGLPEPLVGAVALGGGLHRLARQIGLKQAMGMILSSRKVDAAEALGLGIATEVVPDGDLSAATERWCEAILKASPMSIRASKDTVMRGLDEPSLEAAMQSQERFPAFAAWRQSEDAREGPRAFAERRVPVWKGR
ncbi:MAG: enoyl-CoA hydratase/isomerase family protein [Sphingomonadales bacterium]|nr:enoyl-CoA hydratase/isomerase family protein [Sphingomonadales bacterium]